MPWRCQAAKQMVFYFTCSDPRYVIYMGRDKHENEHLIAYGWPEDLWFHVDSHSSAHVYLRLPKGETIDDVPDEIVQECSQLCKANSIEGSKLSHVRMIYTPWANLKKTEGMADGQVGYHSRGAVRHTMVEHRVNAVVNRLNKTKVEMHNDPSELARLRRGRHFGCSPLDLGCSSRLPHLGFSLSAAAPRLPLLGAKRDATAARRERDAAEAAEARRTREESKAAVAAEEKAARRERAEEEAAAALARATGTLYSAESLGAARAAALHADPRCADTAGCNHCSGARPRLDSAMLTPPCSHAATLVRSRCRPPWEEQ